MAQTLLTSVVGSYPQPDWLVDRALLTKMMAPRVRAHEVWRVPPERLEEAQDDATIVAIREQERAGIDSSRTRSTASTASGSARS
jgi:5-methyltetrahydropteroyltriglutamate--homocysteine methyltransferase